MKTSLGFTRRRFVRDMAVVAGATALGSVGPRWASADSKMVLGTWGGDYSKLLTQNVETPLLKPKGIEVVHDIAGDPQRRGRGFIGMPGAQPLIDFIIRVENSPGENVGAADEIRLEVALQHEYLDAALSIPKQDHSRRISD